jgi:hypothetical protein
VHGRLYGRCCTNSAVASATRRQARSRGVQGFGRPGCQGLSKLTCRHSPLPSQHTSQAVGAAAQRAQHTRRGHCGGRTAPREGQLRLQRVGEGCRGGMCIGIAPSLPSLEAQRCEQLPRRRHVGTPIPARLPGPWLRRRPRAPRRCAGSTRRARARRPLRSSSCRRSSPAPLPRTHLLVPHGVRWDYKPLLGRRGNLARLHACCASRNLPEAPDRSTRRHSPSLGDAAEDCSLRIRGIVLAYYIQICSNNKSLLRCARKADFRESTLPGLTCSTFATSHFG